MITPHSKSPGPARVVAIGFALGSIEHLIGLVLHTFHIEMYSNYPAWRHAAFAAVDAGIAFVGFTRPQRLFFPVVAFLIEQILINGSYAWRTWRASGKILWTIPVMIVLIGAGAVIALSERAHGRSRELSVRRRQHSWRSSR